MSDFVYYLDSIANSQGKDERGIAEEKARVEIKGDLEKLSSNEMWERAAAVYGDWVKGFPALVKSNKEKAHKDLNSLIDVAIYKNELVTKENVDALIQRIKRCKSLEQLQALETGQLPFHFERQKEDGSEAIIYLNIPLTDRIVRLAKQTRELQSSEHILAELEEKRNYLKAKQRADKVAWPLTIILSLLGVGVIGGIALFAAFPVIGIVGFVAASLVIGYVEIPVYYGYIKRSLRNLFARGVFTSIDNHLLNQLAQEQGLKNRHDLKNSKELLSQNWLLRGFKYGLTVLGGLVSMAATIGFAALAYTQVLELLPLLGIAGGFFSVATPAFFAVLAGLYFFVVFDNLFRAVKNNIFRQIWEQIKELYMPQKDVNLLQHILSCVLKSVGVLFILGISIIATVFTAGAWLQSSVNFFAGAFSLLDKVAKGIGWAVGGVQLLTTLGFNIENSFKTAAQFSHLTWQGVKNKVSAYVREAVKRVEDEPFLPKKIGIAIWEIVKPFVTIIPITLHVVADGMVTAKGADAFALQPILGPNEVSNRTTAVLTQAFSEVAVDVHTLGPDHTHEDNDKHEHEHDKHEHGHDKHHAHHEHKKCDVHEHSDPVGDLERLGKGVVTFFQSLTHPKEAPKKIEEFTIPLERMP